MYICFPTAGVIKVHFVAVKNVDTGKAPSIKAVIDEVMKAQWRFMDKEIGMIWY